MSQGLTSSRAAGPSPTDQKKIVSSTLPRTLPPIHDDRLQNVPRSAGFTPATSQKASTSQPSGLSNTSNSRSAGPVGMQNLLNPSGQNVSPAISQRRSADHLDQMPTSASTPQLLPSRLSQSPNNHQLPSITPPSDGSYTSLVGQPPRRLLTARTASLYNAPPNTAGLPSATIDATKSPFVAARDPSLPTGLSTQNFTLGLQGPPIPEPSYGVPPPFKHSPPGRRPSTGAPQLHNIHERRASAGGLASQPPASQSNSPSTSYSSYSRFSRTPPAPHANVATSQPSSFFAPHHDGKGSMGSSAPTDFEPKAAFGPVSSSMGHGTLQLMTLDTEQGPIQVPVDVTAASKVADEKRKRNATASHRFRQRRKEKERETSQNIAKLEHQIRELAEERDYYRLERDYFRTFSLSESGQAHYPPRPPSPRQVRLAHLNGENGKLREGQWQVHDEHSNHGRNTRRRTSAYTPATGIVPPVNADPSQLLRHNAATSNFSENADRRPMPGNKPANLPGPPVMANGPYDPSTRGNYNRG